MTETIGTLNLKILRLEHQLELLKRQQLLSESYPEHQARLVQKTHQIEFELAQLKKLQDELLQHNGNRIAERLFVHGNGKRQTTFCSIN